MDFTEWSENSTQTSAMMDEVLTSYTSDNYSKVELRTSSCQITVWDDSGFNLTRGYVEIQVGERVDSVDMQLGESVTPNKVVSAPDDK